MLTQRLNVILYLQNKKVYVSTAILLLKFIDIFCILPQLRWNINPLRDKPLVAPKTAEQYKGGQTPLLRYMVRGAVFNLPPLR